MRQELQQEWWELTNAPSGERFAQFNERQRARSTPLSSAVFELGGVAALCCGVTFVWSNPLAALWFPVAALLFAGKSRRVARGLDAIDVAVTRLRRAYRAWRARGPQPEAASHDSDSLEIPRPPSAQATAVRGERLNSHRMAMQAARDHQPVPSDADPRVIVTEPPPPSAPRVIVTESPSGAAARAQQDAPSEPARPRRRPLRDIPATMKFGSWAVLNDELRPVAQARSGEGLVKPTAAKRRAAEDAVVALPMIVVSAAPEYGAKSGR
jgi:hypothetical protein